MTILKGLVRESVGKYYSLQTDDNIIFRASLKGKLRLIQSDSTNPIAVGDWVLFVLDDHLQAIITEVLPRKNYVIRKSVNLSKQKHVLAANLDLAILMITHRAPKTSSGFIDRFLIVCEMFHVPVLLLFNKIDLLNEPETKDFESLANSYQAIGYNILWLSALNLELETKTKLIGYLKNNTTLIMGHSGVGKSSLINTLSPGINLKTASVSEFNNKGKHTTTFAHMHSLDFEGNIIDTPGIKELGLLNVSKKELSRYFKEWLPYIKQCKFDDCTHQNEPQCKVIDSLNKKIIPLFRYQNYIKMLHEIIDSNG